MSRFEVGSLVRSRVDAQGLAKGETYEVLEATTKHNFLGGFTTYSLTGRSHAVFGKTVSDVGNGHLVLESA